MELKLGRTDFRLGGSLKCFVGGEWDAHTDRQNFENSKKFFQDGNLLPQLEPQHDTISFVHLGRLAVAWIDHSPMNVGLEAFW